MPQIGGNLFLLGERHGRGFGGYLAASRGGLVSRQRRREIGVVAESLERLRDVSNDKWCLLGTVEGSQLVLDVVDSEFVGAGTDGEEVRKRLANALGDNLLRSGSVEELEVSRLRRPVAIQEFQVLEYPEEQSVVRRCEAKVLKELDREPLGRLSVENGVEVRWYAGTELGFSV